MNKINISIIEKYDDSIFADINLHNNIKKIYNIL